MDRPNNTLAGETTTVSRPVGHWREPLLVVVLCLAAIGLGQVLASRPGFQAPAGSKGDLLTQMFGEARTVISLSMIDRAELYFHGGVADLDCSNPLMNEEKKVTVPPPSPAAGNLNRAPGH